jgi:hypothetical protein
MKDAAVESRPFGFAQGRLLRTKRARMGHWHHLQMRGKTLPSFARLDSRGRLSLREQEFFCPQFFDRIPQLSRLLKFKSLGRLPHIAL